MVNTTSLGMTGKPEMRVPLDGLRPGTVVTDLVYAPLQTRLLKAAEAAGWQPITLGPRVLRTETAGMAALAALQSLWGDLAG